MSADHGSKTTGDVAVDITALIYYVAPQLTGERPVQPDTQKHIDRLAELRRSGKLTKEQEALLDRIQLFGLDTDPF